MDNEIEKVYNELKALNPEFVKNPGRRPLKGKSSQLAKNLDHTVLILNATDEVIKTETVNTLHYGFATICLPANKVSYAKKLGETNLNIATVISFPNGDDSTESKVAATRNAVADGADEIDVVISITNVKDHNWAYVYDDLVAVVDASEGRDVKVIIETSCLTNEEKIAAGLLVRASKAAFVKTSTGTRGGATVEDVKLIKSTVGDLIGIKASGGIRTRKQAEEMLEAGATRLGTSASITIIEPDKSDEKQNPGY